MYRLQNRSDCASRVVPCEQFVSSISCLLSTPHPPYHSLMTNIVYMPETIAENPSALRERAYLDNIPVASPVLDPGGWKLLPPVEAVGTLVPNATVTAQLSIANPVRTCFSYLTVVDVHYIWDSCHLHWVHRFRYFSSYLVTGLDTLTLTRSMFVSSAPSLLIPSRVAYANLTSHALRSGERQAPLLTG